MRRWKLEWYSRLDGHKIDEVALGLSVRYFFTLAGAKRCVDKLPPSMLVRPEITRVSA